MRPLLLLSSLFLCPSQLPFPSPLWFPLLLSFPPLLSAFPCPPPSYLALPLPVSTLQAVARSGSWGCCGGWWSCLVPRHRRAPSPSLAPAFPPASSCSQKQGQVLGWPILAVLTIVVVVVVVVIVPRRPVVVVVLPCFLSLSSSSLIVWSSSPSPTVW